MIKAKGSPAFSVWIYLHSAFLFAFDMPLIRRDVFYITVALTERTQLHVSAHNDLLSTRLHDTHENKNLLIQKEKTQVFYK